MKTKKMITMGVLAMAAWLGLFFSHSQHWRPMGRQEQGCQAQKEKLLMICICGKAVRQGETQGRKLTLAG